MPRKPKPKNTLTAGERAAIYEAEQREKLARMNADDPSSDKDDPAPDVAKKDASALPQERDSVTDMQSGGEIKKKTLPKPQKAVVKVDLSIPVGEINPLHGMCNGPVSYGADISGLFKEIGVPCVRFDGTDTPMSGCAVDISKIFRSFDADPSDEANYDFTLTDKYVTAARMTGAEIIYRLGESRDLLDPKKRARHPDDLDILARVCVNIIRHYNDRWASGFSLDIKRFEIWSRDASGKVDLAEDMEIYRRIANAVKLYDEELKVGGMCFGGKVGEIGEFLRYCKKNHAPVDFVTIDCFGDTPESCLHYVSSAMKSIRNYGNDIELIIGKWAYIDADGAEAKKVFEILSGSGEKSAALRKKIFADRYSLKNAAFSAAFLLGLESLSGVSCAFAYDAQPVISPFCTVADRMGDPQKPYYAFKAFGELYRAKNKVFCECESPEGFAHSGIYASAAVSDGGEACVMIASFDGCGTVDLRLDGIPDNLYTAEVYMLDGVKDLESAASVAVSGTQKRLVLNVSPYGVVLVKLY